MRAVAGAVAPRPALVTPVLAAGCDAEKESLWEVEPGRTWVVVLPTQVEPFVIPCAPWTGPPPADCGRVWPMRLEPAVEVIRFVPEARAFVHRGGTMAWSDEPGVAATGGCDSALLRAARASFQTRDPRVPR